MAELRATAKKLGENMVSAADSIDPVAIKEIYRDGKTLQEVNAKLRSALEEARTAELQGDAYRLVFEIIRREPEKPSIEVDAILTLPDGSKRAIYSKESAPGTHTADMRLGHYTPGIYTLDIRPKVDNRSTNHSWQYKWQRRESGAWITISTGGLDQTDTGPQPRGETSFPGFPQEFWLRAPPP